MCAVYLWVWVEEVGFVWFNATDWEFYESL